MERLSLRISLLTVVLVCLSGCKEMGLFKESDPIDSSVVATWWDGPRIKPGVALIIQIGTAATAPQVFEVQVDQKGEITIPLLLQQPIECDGLTLEAMKQKLVKAYSSFYRQPQVTVTFGPVGPAGVSPWGTVTVLGEVANPGPVNMPSTMDLTVTKVLQAAGGLKPFADRTRIRVTRSDKDGRQTRMSVDLDEIGEEGRVDKDIVLRAGDVVFVKETWY